MITTMLTMPVPVGLSAVSDVLELTVTCTLTPPNVTEAPAVKPLPLTTTLVPPAEDPMLGLTAVTTGTGS